MNFKEFVLARHPNWQTFPETLQDQMMPDLLRHYKLQRTAVGQAQVLFEQRCGLRHFSKRRSFELAVECLRKTGAL